MTDEDKARGLGVLIMESLKSFTGPLPPPQERVIALTYPRVITDGSLWCKLCNARIAEGAAARVLRVQGAEASDWEQINFCTLCDEILLIQYAILFDMDKQNGVEHRTDLWPPVLKVRTHGTE